MGYDDGDCEVSPTGAHHFEVGELVLDERGTLNRVHCCAWCPAVAYQAAEDPEARPAL